MNKEIMKKAGFTKEVEQVERGNCPTCGKPVFQSDFCNEISLKEFGISGMCRKCQDDFFGAD